MIREACKDSEKNYDSHDLQRVLLSFVWVGPSGAVGIFLATAHLESNMKMTGLRIMKRNV